MTNQPATLAGKVSAQGRATLAQFQEWHNECRDVNDAGSVYTLLVSMERTCRASEIDLGLDF